MINVLNIVTKSIGYDFEDLLSILLSIFSWCPIWRETFTLFSSFSLTFFSFQLKNYFYLSSKSILQILRSRLVPGFFGLTASHKKTIVFVMNVAYWLNTVEARHGALSSDCDRCSWVETIFDLINLLNSICLQLCSFIICVASQVVQGTMITASDL